MVVIFADQASKWIITRRPEQASSRAGRAVLQIRLVPMQRRNRDRVTFSAVILLSLLIVVTLCIVSLVHYKIAYQNAYVQIALGGALGGAASNLLDRFWRKGVVDFIRLGFWPAFNLADVAICVGALAALAALL
jgi:lipoprotein signal peptidase